MIEIQEDSVLNLQIIIDAFLHLDKYLNVLIGQNTVLAYVFLFLVIFIETGVVILPFLPGDSLLFAAGALAAAGAPINIPLLLVILYIAAVGGDTLNYYIGHLMRRKIENREHIRFIKMEYIDKTQAFFKRNGGKTITIARFIPIIRTFAPFIAGVGDMPYKWFLSYNVIGGVSWVSALFGIGYFFGNIQFIKNHFSLVVVAIVIISVMPAVVSIIKSKTSAAKANTKSS
jgi:membrane-associated protein